jgi:hypothetical protein
MIIFNHEFLPSLGTTFPSAISRWSFFGGKTFLQHRNQEDKPIKTSRAKQRLSQHDSASKRKSTCSGSSAIYLNAKKTRHWALSCLSCCSLKGMPDKAEPWKTGDFPTSLGDVDLIIVSSELLVCLPPWWWERTSKRRGGPIHNKSDNRVSCSEQNIVNHDHKWCMMRHYIS